MEFALPILLVALGVSLVILDVFVPSMGIMTLVALGCFACSLVLAFGVSSGFGWSLVAALVLGLPVLLALAFRFFPRTRLGRHMMLPEPDDTAPLHPESFRSDLLGRTGLAVTPLRPSGIAEIGGERVDVVTRGEMIEAGTPIAVLDNKGNRILVRALDSGTPDKENTP